MAAALSLIMGLFGVREGIAKVIAIAIGILVALGAVWGCYEIVKRRGADEVRQEIKDQVNEAGIKGSEARLSRADCVTRDGVYDFRRQVCTGLAPGDR